MRRIRVVEARAGMVLGGNVHDAAGVLLLAAGDELTDADLELLAKHRVSHVVIDEPPAPEAAPVFPSELEARAMQALSTLIVVQQVGVRAVARGELAPLDSLMNRLAECAMNADSSEDDFAGSDSVLGQLHVHPIRVAELAMCIAAKAGYKRLDVHALGMAAALMNLGYIPLRRSGIDEPRPLDEDEWEDQARRHPEKSAELLTDAVSQLTSDTILQHHERWDGSGYPARLAGDALAPLARILAIADTYVSLRSDRPHRPAFGPREARQFVIAGSGSLFDPAMVVAFERTVPRVRPPRPGAERPLARAPEAHPPQERRAEHAPAAPEDVPAPQPRPEAQASEPAEPTSRPLPPDPAPAPAPRIVGRTAAPAAAPVRASAQRAASPVRPSRRRRSARVRRRRSLWSAEVYLDLRAGDERGSPPF
jgi:hypothetical protein